MYACFMHFMVIMSDIQLEKTYVKVFLQRALLGHASVL